MSCGGSLVKYTLFVFNFIWLVLGGVLLYFGFRVALFAKDYKEVLKDVPSAGAILLLVIGFTIFFIAFLGCCGAIRESHCMLVMYAGIVLLFVIGECVGAYLAFKYHNDIEGKIQTEMKTAIDDIIKASSDEKSGLMKAINALQKAFDCCGVENCNNWNGWKPHKEKDPQPQLYPPSCCGKDIDSDNTCSTTGPNCAGLREGCKGKIYSDIKGALGGLGGIAIGLVCVQLLIVVSACCLAREVKHHH